MTGKHQDRHDHCSLRDDAIGVVLGLARGGGVMPRETEIRFRINGVLRIDVRAPRLSSVATIWKALRDSWFINKSMFGNAVVFSCRRGSALHERL
jgi:hypothetical protein